MRKPKNDITPTGEILNAYASGCDSLKSISRCTGYSWQKVSKTLSSHGIFVCENQRETFELHKQGKTNEEISMLLGISLRTVYAYLPHIGKPRMEDRTKNALRIEKCRRRKRGN